MSSPVCVRWLAGWFVSRISEKLSMKLRWRTGLGPEWTPLTFGADPDKRTYLSMIFGMDPYQNKSGIFWRLVSMSEYKSGNDGPRG